MSTLNVKAAEEGMDSNHLRDELTECIATNATLSQQICQLQFREEEQNNKLRMMMADLSAKEKEYQSQIFELLNKRADVQENCQFTLQVKVNENLLLKSHLDECLDNKRALEYDLALLQVKCDDASSSVWQLQDQLESEMEAAVCKEQELASTLNVLKLENIALQSELKGARQVTASLEDALASAVATRELKALDTTHDRPTHDVITCLQLKFGNNISANIMCIHLDIHYCR
jgi:predicted  nucleic acid-binding Zn-ribbon protein